VDLEDLEFLEGDFRDRVLEYFDTLDILINNAGLLIHKPFADISREEAGRMMTVNFTVPLILVRTLLPLLERAGTAHVLNIGSMGGVQGSEKFPGLSVYSASKAAVHVLTECLAAEFPGSGVHFNALALGAVETEMFGEAFPDLQAPLKDSEMAEFVVEFALRGHRYFNGKVLPVSLSTP
jgi:NAD(P)-dependent dehydrogenase (short-subunit alcohol dehydrogenase family)